ncbi:MAG: peptide deformylase [Peptococcaceae bacterium]|nr:peptide deformylase [Peptococcaceae bacterium]
MAVFQVVKVGENILRDKAMEIKKINSNIHKLLDNMAETMYAAKGVGLAAPQIGVSKRAVVLDAGDGLIELINPVIIEKSGKVVDREGCLSIPNVTGDVERAKRVVVEALDRNGVLKRYEAEDLLARIFQHEIDHLDGILFIDIAQKIYKDE